MIRPATTLPRRFNQTLARRSLFTRPPPPPRSSYIANKTYPAIIWHNLIPTKLKYLATIGIASWPVAHAHPNTVIILGPPLLLGSYFGYKKFRHFQYLSNLKRIGIDYMNKDEIVRFEKYDETSVENVMNGIENEFDCLKRQVIDVVEGRIVEYIAMNDGAKDNNVLSLFMDENDQFSINISENEIETWMTSQAEVSDLVEGEDEGKMVKTGFMKLSLPFYSRGDAESKKRLGTISVYLLQVPPTENNDQDYKIGIEITPLSWFKPKSLYFSELPGKGIFKSKLHQKVKLEDQ
ncbi:uncharacterized protein J8A68_001363 [[Candida] subhashii]|uniref:Uncharacterized protein n=1 Tax=[Candida] subhashii TaxID=561895 RepID=A0A8J5QG58_9ASCO|nr:uncharacterized protein J8A68_001363 [[Candida] subhashii]KAG7665054.1 hypothetical protein J8A68_001363 [[Candida] subhashii]